MKSSRHFLRILSLVLLTVPTASLGAAVAFDTKNAATQKYVVQIHNMIREAVHATPALPPVSWDADLATKAQAWASNCVFRHPTQNPTESKQYLSTSHFARLGQNIGYTSGGSSWENTVQNQWAGERKDFQYGQKASGAVGDYIQIVGRSTKLIGCGYAKCSFGDYFVCDYAFEGDVVPDQLKPY